MSTSTNLVSIIGQFITPDMLGRAASALGVDRAAAQKAVGAGVPGILAALTSLLARPGGTSKIENAIDEQQPGLLASVGSMLGTSQQSGLLEQGLGSLSSLLGGNTTTALASALNRYAGLGDTGAKGLLGLLAPIVMGVLGQQQGRGGVAQLLESQKDNIARAMPAGFANYLSGTGLLDQLPTAAAAQPTRSRQGHEAEGDSPRSWLLPALATLALLGLGWYLLSGPSTETTVATVPTTETGMRPTAGQMPFVVTESELAGWMHKPVYSSENKKIGEIAQLVRDPENRVTDIYMDADTTLGIGAERYHISADQVREVRPDGVVLSVTETQVKAMEKASEPSAR